MAGSREIGRYGGDAKGSLWDGGGSDKSLQGYKKRLVEIEIKRRVLRWGMERMERMVGMRARMETRSQIHRQRRLTSKPYLEIPHNMLRRPICCIDGEDVPVNSIYGHRVYTRNDVGNLTASRLSLDEFGIDGCISCFPDLAVRPTGQYRLNFESMCLSAFSAGIGTRMPFLVDAMSDVLHAYRRLRPSELAASMVTQEGNSLEGVGLNEPTASTSFLAADSSEALAA